MPVPAHRCGLRRPPIQALGAVLLLSLLAVAASAATAQTGPDFRAARAQVFRLDHFLCYAVDPGVFAPRPVRLRDQLGPRAARLERVELLCNPVSKNREPVLNRRAHLVCYRQSAQRIRQRRIIVTNQLGRFRGVVVTPLTLCLPSGKSRGDDVPPPAERLDHYTCYAVRTTTQPRPRRVQLADQFGRMTATVRRNHSVCMPASKNGSRVLNRRDHLTCVTIAAPAFEPVRVLYTNQFERGQRLVAIRPLLLCLPSQKRLVAP